MTGGIFWLIMTALMTAVFWLPYVLDRIVVRGLFRTMGNPADDDAPLHDWAQRAYYAHTNAIENLVVFGILVLIAAAAGLNNDPTIIASAGLFFYARLLHFVVYTAGVPVLRTLSYAAGWAACIVIGLRILGVL